MNKLTYTILYPWFHPPTPPPQPQCAVLYHSGGLCLDEPVGHISWI